MPTSRTPTFLRKLGHFLRYNIIRLANLSHDTSTGLHISIKSPMEKRIYEDVFDGGDYDDPINKLLELKEGSVLTVLDLGSNVGFFTFRLIHLALSSGTTHQFHIQGVEASQKLCDESIERFKGSTFSKEKFAISIHHGLIGPPAGEGIFYQFRNHGLSSVFRKDGKPETITFIDLHAITSHWQEIDLLKCDIEGSELIFLKNYPLLLEKVRFAVFEFHLEFCNYNSCVDIIHQAGLTNSKVICQSPQAVIEFFWK
jgi:FkbM family methyltransferase